MDYLPPSDKDTLEDLTAQILPKVFGSVEPAMRYGRSGQGQFGVDVVMRSTAGLIGAQCKAYNKKKLMIVALNEELRKAHDFEPHLSRYIVVTTAPRDAPLVAWALSSTIHGQSTVQIWFWEDLFELLIEHDLIGPYIARTLSPRALIAGAKALGLTLTGVSASDTGGLAPDIDDAETKALDALMGAGQANTVVARLSVLERPTDSQRFALARAYVQLRQDDNARIALIGCSSSKPLALAGLVNARLHDDRASQTAIDQAFHRADTHTLAYVAGMAILCRLQLQPGTDLETLSDLAPAQVREHAIVLSALGDAASQLDLHAQAIHFYQSAEQQDGRSTVLRRLAILANRLGLVLANMPSGDLYVHTPQQRNELEAVRVGLREELNESMDIRLRVATLHNVHVAALGLRDFEDSGSAIQQAIELEPSEPGLWRRWAFVTLVNEAPIDEAFLARAPSDPSLALMLSQLDVRAGQRKTAIARLEAALRTPSLEASLESRLAAQRIVVDGEHDTLSPSQGEKILALAKTLRSPAPALVRIASAIDAPGMEDVAEGFFEWLALSDLDGLEEDDQLALVAALVDQSHARQATRYVPMLRRRLTRSAGAIDPGVAPLLFHVLMGNLRFHEALALAERFVSLGSNYGLFLKTLVLTSLGLPGRALDEVMTNPALAETSTSLIRRSVELGTLANRLREVQRFVRSLRLPTAQSASQQSSLYGALVTLRDPRRDELAVDALRMADGFDDVAATYFAHGLRGHRPETGRISANAIVTIQRDDGYRGDYWVGTGPSPSPDAPDAAWLSPVLGFEVGDYIVLLDGPFAGERVRIVASKRPEQVLIERALAAAREEGSVVGFNGTTDELVATMREQLREQALNTAQSLSNASAHAVPASSMAEHTGKPARVFLRAEGHWIPRCHTGSRADLDAEVKVLLRKQRWVIDPASLCLIVECGLEGLLTVDGVRPWITAQTRLVLRTWQLQETRNSRGSRGTMHLGTRGRLIFIESSARTRKPTRLFWRKLWNVVERACDVGPEVSDDAMASLSSWSAVLDLGTLSSIALAKETSCTLLSDELTARRAAAAEGVEGASLRGMVVQAIDSKLTTSRNGVRRMSALANTGRSFFSISTWMLVDAMQLSSNERFPAIRALLSTLRTANPFTTWPMLLVALALSTTLLSGSHRSRLNEKALMRLTLKYAPAVTDQHLLRALDLLTVGEVDRSRLSRTWKGRQMRSLRRAMSRYLVKQASRNNTAKT